MPSSRLKSSSKVLQKSKRHDTSTPKKNSKGSKSGVSNSKQDRLAQRDLESQYEVAPSIAKNTRYLKFPARLTRTWRPLEKDTRQQMYTVIDSAVKAVGSKPMFAEDDDVQALLSQMKLKLKSKLHSVRVPKKRGRSTVNLRTKMTYLQEEAERLKLQTSELERELRQEERKIEALEDARLLQSPTNTDISFQVPESELDLPAMVFYNT